MSALLADERFQRPAVEMDGRLQNRPWKPFEAGCVIMAMVIAVAGHGWGAVLLDRIAGTPLFLARVSVDALPVVANGSGSKDSVSTGICSTIRLVAGVKPPPWIQSRRSPC